MTTKKLYPVVDRLTIQDKEALGLPVSWTAQPLPSLGMPARDVHAVTTGEFRAPKKGEWYLSGAIVEAYRAPNDLTQAFNIVRLVRTVTKTVTTVAAV